MSHAAHRAVLYVEDDRINIILMEEVFRRVPEWKLACAEDGTQALALLDGWRPDLVVIDMNLPDMTGLDLLRRMRADTRHAELLCVALSADGQPGDVAAALSAGFSEYWLKPIDVAQLTAALKSVLHQA